MKFEVTITETLCRTVQVEANSADEAEKEVVNAYGSGEIVLDWSDYSDTEFSTDEC